MTSPHPALFSDLQGWSSWAAFTQQAPLALGRHVQNHPLRQTTQGLQFQASAFRLRGWRLGSGKGLAVLDSEAVGSYVVASPAMA